MLETEGTEVQPTFGELLREARNRAGLTLVQVAEHLGITHGYLADIERNRRAPLPGEKINNVAKFLRADPKPLHQAAARARGTLDVTVFSDAELELVNDLASLPRDKKRQQLSKELQALVNKHKQRS
jgi:transcriptional regulator with XRE-family HTH domain